MKICLDAGHYGKYNRSPAIPEYYESEMNWKLLILLKKYLEDYGFEVKTTRSEQAVDLELTARGKKSKGCDLFLSLHSNATGNGEVNEEVDHVVIFRMVDDNSTEIDEKSKELAEKLAPVITKVMGVKQKEYSIRANKSSNDRNKDGVLNDNYYGVLHGARLVGTPALILEHSFHTNTRSTKWLMNDDNLDKLAKAEAEVVAKYFCVQDSKKKNTYYVQVGSFLLKSNATKRKSELESKGFSAIVKKSGVHYRVQVGAYTNKKNANSMVSKLLKAGYTAYVTTEGGTQVE